MIFKMVTVLAFRLARQLDAPQRPFIVAPPCQSDIKRTLKRPAGRQRPDLRAGFACRQAAHSIRM